MKFHNFTGIAVITLLTVVCSVVSAQEYAIVNISVASLYSKPDYESPLETQVLMGDKVEILEKGEIWTLVRCNQPYTAWCPSIALTMMTARQMEAYEQTPGFICLTSQEKLYVKPSESSPVAGDLVQGDVLRSANPRKSRGRFVEVLLPDGKCAYVLSSSVADYDKWKSKLVPSASKIIDLAESFIGIPYTWGGMTPRGFDCSGLVRHCFMMNGISLPRNASQQATVGTKVPVSPGDYKALLPGDLLFFGTKGNFLKGEKVTHVGIYIGSGMFIHSSHIVRINSIDPKDGKCYERVDRLLFARRILQ